MKASLGIELVNALHCIDITLKKKFNMTTIYKRAFNV